MTSSLIPSTVPPLLKDGKDIEDYLTPEEIRAIKRVKRAFKKFPKSLGMFGGVPGLIFVKYINGICWEIDEVTGIQVDGGCRDDIKDPETGYQFGGVPGLIFVKYINGICWEIDEVTGIQVDGGCGDDIKDPETGYQCGG